MTVTVLRDTEVRGRRLDVLLRDDQVDAVGARLSVPAGATEVDAGGGALLPGLHDHHVHVLALAAHRLGVDASAHADLASLVAAVRAAPGDRVRVTGYHESLAGPLDRRVLDAWEPARPVRVQHHSGALWMLNTQGLEEVRHVLDDSADVERDATGEPTGRLWRYDTRLRPALEQSVVDLAPVGALWVGLGVTGLTDATPALDADALAVLVGAQRSGALPQRLHLLGPDEPVHGPDLSTGPRKILLRDHDLPDVEELTLLVRQWHDRGRGVAVHAVTAESLVLTLTALEAAGPHPDDRVEHASVVPPGTEAWLAGSGATVVTQPDFLRTRGERYRRELDDVDLASLYRHRSLREAGIGVAVSSDAPFGDPDPWRVVASASDRRTAEGHVLGAGERVTTEEALGSYLSDPTSPAGAPRRIEPGARADLCLLADDLRTVLREPSAERVRLTVTARGGTHRLHAR